MLGALPLLMAVVVDEVNLLLVGDVPAGDVEK